MDEIKTEASERTLDAADDLQALTSATLPEGAGDDMSDDQKLRVGRIEFDDPAARRAAPLSEERRAEIRKRAARYVNDDALKVVTLRAEVARLSSALADSDRQRAREPLDRATDEMILYAFRYCLGRATYATANCADYLIANWDRLSAHTRGTVLNEITRAFDEKRYGHDTDREEWERVLTHSSRVRPTE